MSEAAQYLLVVYRLAQSGSEPVAPGRVAAELDRSPAATTEMLQRLADRGLLNREPYNGVCLTDDGRETAAELTDTYRILVRFFRDVIDLAEPETEALALAGSISPLVADRLETTVLGAESPTDAPSQSLTSKGVSTE